MKYFLLSVQAAYTDIPQIAGWYEKINPRWINPKDAYRLPKRELLFVREQDNIVFTDILSKPFFLVSDMVRKVILMYEPLTNMKEIVLLDTRHKVSRSYFLPILEEVDCMTEDSEFNADRSIIKKGILDYDIVKDRTIFAIGGMKNRYIVGNLELVESLIKRGAVGIGLRELAYRDV